MLLVIDWSRVIRYWLIKVIRYSLIKVIRYSLIKCYSLLIDQMLFVIDWSILFVTDWSKVICYWLVKVNRYWLVKCYSLLIKSYMLLIGQSYSLLIGRMFIDFGQMYFIIWLVKCFDWSNYFHDMLMMRFTLTRDIAYSICYVIDWFMVGSVMWLCL